MKICVLTTSYPRTPQDDASPFVARLAEAFVAGGDLVTVIVPHDGAEPREETRDGVAISRFTAPRGIAFGAGVFQNLRRAPWLVFALPLFLRRMYDAAANWASWTPGGVIQANWIFASCVAAVLHHRKKIPFIATIRGAESRVVTSFFGRLFFRPVLSRALAVTTVSADIQQRLRGAFPKMAAKIHFIPNGVALRGLTTEALKDFTTRHQLDATRRYLVAVGNVIPRKRIELLIEILRAPQLAEFSLLIVGRSEDQSYQAYLKLLIAEFGLEDRVRFLGAIPPHEIPAVLSVASLAISASADEGRPNAILETFAARLPVVASDIAPHRELLGVSGERGLLFGTAAEGAAAVERVFADSAMRHAIVDAAAEFVADLTWSGAAERYRAAMKSGGE